MASTYSEIKSALDEISVRLRANVKRLDQSLTSATVAESDLTAMQTAYSAIVADIDTLASGSSDAAVLAAKAEKDLLVAEFLALKTTATNVKTAIEGV